MPRPRNHRYAALTTALTTALATALATALTAAAVAGCDPAPDAEPPGPPPPAASTSRRPLADALLTPADIPPDYRPAARPTGADADESWPAKCGPAFDALEIDVASGSGVEEQRANFATPGDFSRIQHIIRRYDTGARDALATARDTVEECSRYVLTFADSTQFEVTTDVVRSTDDGFDAAVHLRAAAFPVEERLLVRAVDDCLVIISHTAPEPPDPAVAEGLMAIAVDRLRGGGPMR